MGGGKGSKAPSSPDYTATAIQQGVQDRLTANAVTEANRPTQISQSGNIGWTQDPTTGRWTQTTTMNPALQASNQAAQGLVTSQLQGLQNQGAFNPSSVPTYDPNAGNAVANAMFARDTAMTQPLQQRATEQLSTQLRQQGLTPGTTAYDNAMKDLTFGQNQANAQAANQAVVGGYNQANIGYGQALQGQNQQYGQQLQNYQLPWDVAGTAESLQANAGQPVMPGFSGATGYNAPDLMGAAQAGYQAKMGNYNAGQQKKGNTTNAALTAGAMAMM